MPHENPWFLITSDEIFWIRDILQSLRREVPDQHRNRIDGAIGIINHVRDRRP